MYLVFAIALSLEIFKNYLLKEGEPFHLECRFTPINDSKLTVHWMKDGVPLQEASRFKFSCEFGFVTFDILYAYTTDTGIYECIAVNEKGEASTQATITVYLCFFYFLKRLLTFWALQAY